MRWIKLTRSEMVGAGLAIAAGIGLSILWFRTRQLDTPHGALHLLIGAIGLVLGGGILLIIELVRRPRRPR